MAGLSAASPRFDAPYAGDASVLLIADGEGGEIAAALEAAGFRVRATMGFEAAAARLDEVGPGLVVIEARGVPEAPLDIVPGCLDTLAGRDGFGVVVLIGVDQIDLAAATLLGSHAQMLCDPGPGELLGALAIARARTAAAPAIGVRDITRDPESVRLQRLNEEVARIADALARLTRGEAFELDEVERRGGIREPGSGYRGPDEGEPPEIAAADIRAVIRSRRLRDQFFVSELFADPAWDMLLDLFASELENRRVSVSSLCIAAAVPPTTALRWIGTMHDAGLFERQADPSDRRRAYIALSEKGLTGMRAYVRAARRAGLGLV